ncbi:unnamed protein product [Moneuplotes crassus]|uniref:Uncharacterized protein n=1 Tax=Euplotes crassus TaxID=5936 RepID=A0AAD1UPQ1_EUPCR|nr:unnamed protein product [Moneuplotes crassus]
MSSTSSEINDEVDDFCQFARLKTVRTKMEESINLPNYRKSMFLKDFQSLKFNSVKSPCSKASKFLKTSHLRKVLFSKNLSSKSLSKQYRKPSPKKPAHQSTKRIRHLSSMINPEGLRIPHSKSTTRKLIFSKASSNSLFPKPRFEEPAESKQVNVLNVKEYLLKSIIQAKSHEIGQTRNKPNLTKNKNKQSPVQDTKFSRELEYYVNKQKNNIRNYFDKTKKNGQNLFKVLRLKPNLSARDLQKLQCGYTDKKNLDMTRAPKDECKVHGNFQVTQSDNKQRKKLKISQQEIETFRTRITAKSSEKTRGKIGIGGRKMSQKPLDSLKTPKIPDLNEKKCSRSGYKKRLKQKLLIKDSYLNLTPLQLLQSVPSTRTMTSRAINTSPKNPMGTLSYAKMFL